MSEIRHGAAEPVLVESRSAACEPDHVHRGGNQGGDASENPKTGPEAGGNGDGESDGGKGH